MENAIKVLGAFTGLALGVLVILAAIYATLI